MTKEKDPEIKHLYTICSGMTKEFLIWEWSADKQKVKSNLEMSSAIQAESLNKDRSIDIKGLWDKKTWNEIWEQIQAELFGEEWCNMEAERLRWMLEEIHFDSPSKQVTEELHSTQIGFKLSEDIESTCKLLESRKKGQRLSQQEKVYIYALLKLGKADKSHIIQNYWISRGTLMNICSEFNREVVHWSSKLARTSRSIIKSDWIARSVLAFVESMKNPFTAQDISCYLYKTYRAKIPSYMIRMVLKGLGLSYKLWKSRPVWYDEEKSSLMKGLFSAKIWKMINDYDLLINIDETMFTRTTMASRSWSVKGKENNLMNICFSNSTSLMTAITSFGDVLSAETRGSVTSKHFIKFLVKLKSFIYDTIGLWMHKWLIIVDNASTHRSREVKDYIEENKLNFAYIPAYSPEMAPVEKYFSILKRVVIKKTTGQQVNWRGDKTKDILNYSMLQISPKVIRNLWRTFTYEIKKSLDDLSKII